ncbi:MAG: EAL domain-containing protein [Gammaproteobacteria bacterium]
MMSTSLRNMIFGVLSVCFTAISAAGTESAAPLEAVSLQLKWLHQFQFAGYYAAKQQGFYAAEGLDVELREISPDKNVVAQVVSGEADFGIGDSGIIARYANGEPIRALGAVFQHDPLVFISKQSSGIISPYEMAGKRLMFNADSTEEVPLRAMLATVGLSENQFTYVRHTFDNNDLIEDKVDVMSAYLTNEPFEFAQKGISLNIINPQNYGFDFYADLLFTSTRELTEHPGRAERFLRATLKGWQYALEHPEELVQLIHDRYRQQLSIAHLRHEAKVVREHILPESIPLGRIDIGRLRRVADLYARLKIARELDDSQLEAFVYNARPELQLSREELAWLDARGRTVRVGIDRDFAPYEWVDAQGRYTGMVADYLRIIERRLGIHFEIVTDKPWPEILEMAQRGELDMLSDATKTPQRERYLMFSRPYFRNPIVIISADNQNYIGNLDHLKGKRVAVEKGYFMQELLTRDYPQIRVVALGGVREALRRTAEGKVDAYVGHAGSAGYVMKQEGMMQLSFSGETGYYSDHSIAVVKSEPLLYGIIEKALATISEAERQRVQNHWLNLKIEQGVNAATVFRYAAGVSLLLLLFGYWIFRLHREVGARRAVETALRQSEANLQAILETEPECIKIVDADGRLVYMNRSGLRMIEAENDPAQVLGRRVGDFVAAQDRAAFAELHRRVLQDEQNGTLEYLITGLKGGVRCMETHAVPFRNGANGNLSVLAVTRDITERKKNEEKLTLAARVFSEAQEAIIITDADGVIVDVNPAYCKITGYNRKEVLGKKPNILKSGKQDSAFYAAMWKALYKEGYWQGELWNRKKSGEIYPELLTLSALRDDSGKTVNYLGLFSDITQIKRQQQTLEHMAHYDPLTGLPNRLLLADRFAQAIARSKREKTLLGICYLDLDGFKPVNDTYGHETGDQLLIRIAERIKNILREEDTVSRLGGDEFVLLVADLVSIEQFESALSRIHHAIAEPVTINDEQVCVTASSGMTIFPVDDNDADTLLRHADQAMYQAKLAGRNCFRLFDPAHNQHLARRREALNVIEQAFEQRRFCLYYQPKVNMKTSKVVGAEALIRWKHPERGVLLPTEFLPVIEGTPLEIALGNWVLEEVLEQLRAWRQIGLKIQIGVNISPRHLQWQEFAQHLEMLLRRFPEIDSQCLQLEVLESSVLVDLISVGNTLRECWQILGVPFALDDFGTGYSSLTHLRHLPVSAVKIDQSFVRDIIDDTGDLAIVEGVIGLARAFKQEAIAEGVESVEHGLILLNIGCEIAQGHAIAPAMPASAFVDWLRRYRSFAEWEKSAGNPLTPAQIQKLIIDIELAAYIKRIEAFLRNGNGGELCRPLQSRKKSHLANWIHRARKEPSADQALLDELQSAHEALLFSGYRLQQQHRDGTAVNASAGVEELAAIRKKITRIFAQF